MVAARIAGTTICCGLVEPMDARMAMAVAGIFNVLVSIFLVKRGYGITGVVIATLLSNIVMAVFYFIASQRYYLTSGKLKYYGRIVFSFLILIGFTIFQRMDTMVTVKSFIHDIIIYTLLSILLISVYKREAGEMLMKMVFIFKKH